MEEGGHSLRDSYTTNAQPVPRGCLVIKCFQKEMIQAMRSLLWKESEGRGLLRLLEIVGKEQRLHQLPWGNEAYEFPVAAVTKHHKLGGLKPQKCTVSPFQRPEVWNQHVGRVGSLCRPCREPMPRLAPSFGWAPGTQLWVGCW